MQLAIQARTRKRDGITTFYIDYYVNGQRKREKAGTSITQARSLLRKRLGEVASRT